jgi:hypothetical protein
MTSTQPAQDVRIADDTPEHITLAAELIRANVEAKRWADYKASIAARLTALHQAGTAPTKFSAFGHSIAVQQGRSTTRYDASGKEQIDDLKAELLQNGHATIQQGDPFWVVREAKPDA